MSIVQLDSALLYDSNIYLVKGSQRTALIDTGTGFAAQAVISNIRDALEGRKLDIVILTHRHYDHVGGLASVIDEFSPEGIYAGPLDAEPLRKGDSESTLGTKFGGSIRPTDVRDFNEGDRLALGGHTLMAISTPGHTIGSVCIIDEDTGALFSGDTLFVGGVGNTTHPTGSEEMLTASLRKLADIRFDGLYPGHGPALKKGGQEQVAKGLALMGVNI